MTPTEQAGVYRNVILSKLACLASVVVSFDDAPRQISPDLSRFSLLFHLPRPDYIYLFFSLVFHLFLSSLDSSSELNK